MRKSILIPLILLLTMSVLYAQPQMIVPQTEMTFFTEEPGEIDVEQLFIINAGDENLDVMLMLQGDQFSVNVNTMITIQPGDSVGVDVSFTATQRGVYQGAISLIANDPLNPRAIVTLEGTLEPDDPGPVEGPQIEVGDTLWFGDVVVGNTLERDLRILNYGTENLEIELTLDSEVFFIQGDVNYTLEPDEAVNVTIAFTPLDFEQYQHFLNITTNDEDNPEEQVMLYGVGHWGNDFGGELLTPLNGEVIDALPYTFTWTDLNENPNIEVDEYIIQIFSPDSLRGENTFIEQSTGMENSFVLENEMLIDDLEYHWTVFALHNGQGRYNYPQRWTFTLDFEAIENNMSVDDVFKGIPSEWAVTSVFPNPFNPEVQIQLAVPTFEEVNILIFDVLGRQVASLHQSTLKPGHHTFNWHPTGAAGVYLLRAENSTGWSEMKKLMYVK
ncbi:choice-of-anchor D domain-containing protein [bacterium]|nr:choice-of-anchor D domain-containing protein [bacterium]